MLNANREAKEIFKSLIDKQKTVLGKNHKDTLDSIHEFNYCFMLDKEHSKALSMFEDLVKVERRVLGEDNQQTLHSLEVIDNCKQMLKLENHSSKR